MSIQQDIKNELKPAMMAKDQVKLLTIRGLMTAMTNELVVLKRKPDGELTDDEALAVLRRQAKQRKDSIEQFTAGGRADLAEKEQAELALIETYLPQMMNQEAIRPIAEAKKDALGVTDKSQAGKLMSEIMKELKGQADGADVKAVVDSLF